MQKLIENCIFLIKTAQNNLFFSNLFFIIFLFDVVNMYDLY